MNKENTAEKKVDLEKEIDQKGITYGPLKHELMRFACKLQNVPENNVDEEGETIDNKFRVKLFDPTSNWTWYISEYDRNTDIAYGWVIGFDKEWGSFSLEELANIRGGMDIGIEIDTYFEPTEIEKIIKAHE